MSSFEWMNFDLFATCLKDSPDDISSQDVETVTRVVIGRRYYAVYGRLREWALEIQDERPSSVPNLDAMTDRHKDLCAWLIRHPERPLRSVGNTLIFLLNARNACD
ncbi:MAG: hypothetical protein O3A46_05565 [Candidatus Poribacteria bacterium]|nr:hypothetical protein [Candidatus Poribacteria bacterium]